MTIRVTENDLRCTLDAPELFKISFRIMSVNTPAQRLIDAASEYMGIEPSEALSSRSREACTVRQFVAYVMVHKMGCGQDHVATTLQQSQGTVSRSVKLVRSYSGDPTCRDMAEAFVKHLYKFIS